MTVCMALVLIAAARVPDLRDTEGVSSSQAGGWVTLTSRHGLDDTVTRLTQAARSRGMSVLAKVAAVRHAGEGRGAAPLVLVLGDHDGHTPVIQDTSHAAPHLPMKLVVAAREDGSTTVSFQDGATLLGDAEVPAEIRGGLRQLPKVVGAVAV